MSFLTPDSAKAQKILSKIVAKAWLDEEFQAKFLSNTNAILEENGLILPKGVECKVNQNTLVGILKSTANSQDNNLVCQIPLPPKPTELTDQPIQSWASANNSDYPVTDCEEGDCRTSL